MEILHDIRGPTFENADIKEILNSFGGGIQPLKGFFNDPLTRTPYILHWQKYGILRSSLFWDPLGGLESKKRPGS